MRTVLIAFVIASSILLTSPCICGCATDLGNISALITQSATSESGISQKEQETAKSIQILGPPAIPFLLPLLKSQNEGVRKLTSYTLRNIDGLGEEHLDALIDSRRRGDGWIPPAIAKIGTPRAIAFLVDELKREKQTHTQLTAAFKILGEKGTPYLVELIRNNAFDEPLMRTVVFIFGELKEKAATAVEPLVEIISNKEGNLKTIEYSVLALGAIGPDAQRTTPLLMRLAQSDPAHFRETVNRSLQSMGAPQAVTALLQRLNEKHGMIDNMIVFRDIAALKENGKSAGPSLTRFLWDNDWDVRVGAARTIGYIGYTEAIPELIKLLNTNHDWRLIYVSVESLGRLQAGQAVPTLTDVSTNYWYPPVRDAAKKAILVITEGNQYGSKYHPGNFAFEFFDYMNVERADNQPAQENNGPQSSRHYRIDKDALSATQLAKLAYKVDMRPFVAVPPEEENTDFTETQVPDVGLKVTHGYLVGCSRGEWGGELVFIDSKRKVTTVLAENIVGIHRFNSEIVVVTGLAHLTFNRGCVYKIKKSPNGQWIVNKWRALPGAPRSSGILQNGNLLVKCLGGIVEILPGGEIEFVNY